MGAASQIFKRRSWESFSLCVNNHIHIEPEWIPEDQNELVDYYSCLVDYDDWMLNPKVFAWLDTFEAPYY